MKLNSLNISHGYFGDRGLHGTMVFKCAAGDVSIEIDKKACKHIIHLCKSGIVSAGHDTIEGLTEDDLLDA